jgi:O-antigen/teichoic acid export membrane protein
MPQNEPGDRRGAAVDNPAWRGAAAPDASPSEGRGRLANFPTTLAIGRVLGAASWARVLSVARGLIIAKILPPSLYGTSAAVAIILAYARYTDLGTSAAAARDLASATGRGDQEAAARTARWMGGFTLGSMLLTATGCFAVSYWSPLDPHLRLALRFFPPIGLATASLAFIMLQWQARGRIRNFSHGTAIAAVADLLASVTLTLLWGLPGLLAAMALAPTIAAIWAIHRGDLQAPSLAPLASARRYLSIGWPLVALGLIDHNLIYIDHIIVLAFFSVRELGVYNVALIATEAVRMVGIAGGVVLGPRLIREYAGSGANLRVIRAHTLLPVQLYAAFVPFVVAGLWIAASHLLPRFYPLYADSLLPMRVLLVSFNFLVVTGGVTTFLFALDKHRRNLFILVPALFFNVAADVLLIHLGWGLLAIAVGSFLTYLLYAAVVLSYVADHFELTTKEWLAFHLGAFLPGGYLMLTLLFLESWVNYQSAAMTGAAGVVELVLLAPLALRGVLIARRLDPSQ